MFHYGRCYSHRSVIVPGSPVSVHKNASTVKQLVVCAACLLMQCHFTFVSFLCLLFYSRHICRRASHSIGASSIWAYVVCMFVCIRGF